MALNIAILAVKGTAGQIDDILPDVYYKTQDELLFEEAAEPEVDRGLSVTTEGDWVIIVDAVGRFIDKETFPLSISKRHEAKIFWLADDPIFRAYQAAERIQEIQGKQQVEAYLGEHNILPLENDGQQLILQLMYNELFEQKVLPAEGIFHKKRFEFYELD